MGKSIFYSLLRSSINVLLPVFTRVEVYGLENLPRTGGYIAAANHAGRIEIPLVYYLLDRDDIILLVAEKYRKYGIVRWLVKQLDSAVAGQVRERLSCPTKRLGALEGRWRTGYCSGRDAQSQRHFDNR